MFGRIWVYFGLVMFAATVVFVFVEDFPVAMKLGWCLLVALCCYSLYTRAAIEVEVDEIGMRVETLSQVWSFPWSDILTVKRCWGGKGAGITVRGYVSPFTTPFSLDYIGTKDYWNVIEQIERRFSQIHKSI